MATMEERLAALEEKVQKLTTPPDDYYMSRWKGEQIDNAVAKINSADGLVTAFNGRSGSVMPQAGDYTAKMVGAASLGADGKIPESQLPQLTSNVTLYVNASTGSDSNPGTSSQPFATIQAAINALPKTLGQYGATISVASESYEEDVILYGFSGGVNRSDTQRYGGLSIIGRNASSVTVRSIRVINCSVPNILISNVTISGGIPSTQGNFSQGGGVLIQNCPSVTLGAVSVENCTVGLLAGSYYTDGGSTVFLNSVSFSNCTNVAVWAQGQQNLFLLAVSGSGNSIGLQAHYGAVINTKDLTMTATTAQSIYAGFINTF